MNPRGFISDDPDATDEMESDGEDGKEWHGYGSIGMATTLSSSSAVAGPLPYSGGTKYAGIVNGGGTDDDGAVPQVPPSTSLTRGLRNLGRPALSPGSLCYLVRSLVAKCVTAMCCRTASAA